MPDSQLASLTAAPAPSATDQVFDALYSAVVTLKLPPGTKVSEVDVAHQLNVSRQPVRDAFFRLSKLGFIVIRPQRATLISKISETAIRRAVFVRTALEVECLRQIIAGDAAQSARKLQSNLADAAEALNDPEPGRFYALDEEFHRLLCNMAQQGHVWDLIREQKAHMDRLRFLTLSGERRKRVIAEHSALVEAITQADAVRSEQLLRDHLGDIINVLTKSRAERSDYFEAT